MPRLKSMGQIIRTTGIFLLGGTLLTLSACAPFDAPGSGGLG